MNTEESVRYEGVNAQGFGIIARRVMRDKDLSIGAKAVYAYFCSLAGGGEMSFPSRETILKELGISSKTYYKHRDALVEAGYLRVEKGYIKASDVPIRRNVYIIASQVVAHDKEELDTKWATDGPTNPVDLKQVLGMDTKSSEDETGTQEQIQDIEEKVEEKSFPQTPGQSQCGKNYHLTNVENLGFPQSPGQSQCGKNYHVVKTTTPIKEKNNNNNKLYVTVRDRRTRKGNSLDEEYHQLSSLSVNKNRLSDGRTVYKKLREKYSKNIIFAAWEAEQARCHGRSEQYYTQLFRWLGAYADADCARIQQRNAKLARKTRDKIFRELIAENSEFRELVEQDEAFQRQMEAGEIFSGEELIEAQNRCERIILIIDENMPKIDVFETQPQVRAWGHVTPEQ